MKGFAKTAKRESWDNRGLPFKLAVGGLAIGVGVFGGKAYAGIATSGYAIAVPVWLLTSAGGALLGTIVQELGKDY